MQVIRLSVGLDVPVVAKVIGTWIVLYGLGVVLPRLIDRVMFTLLR